MKIKTKVNKWDLIKLKRFCTAKETIKKNPTNNNNKKNPTEWEKIFANERDKRLVYKIYKQFTQLKIKEQQQQKIKSNGWKILLDLSPKKTYRQTAKRHKKGSSVSLITAAAKSLQSCPTLRDPIDGSPPSFPSLGFSRQEHWSGLPFPSPMHESEKSK